MRSNFLQIPALIKTLNQDTQDNSKALHDLSVIELVAVSHKCEDDGDAFVKLNFMIGSVDHSYDDFRLIDDVLDYLSKKLGISRHDYAVSRC